VPDDKILVVLDLDLDLMASRACGNKMAEEKKVSELPNHSFTCHHGFLGSTSESCSRKIGIIWPAVQITKARCQK